MVSQVIRSVDTYLSSCYTEHFHGPLFSSPEHAICAGGGRQGQYIQPRYVNGELICIKYVSIMKNIIGYASMMLVHYM